MTARIAEQFDADSPEIIIDSIYPETTSRKFRTSVVAERIGTDIGGFGRHFIKNFESAIKKGLAKRGFDKVSDVNGNTVDLETISRDIHQKIQEYVDDALYGDNRGRFANEESVAIRAVDDVLTNIYGETVMVQGWEAGSRIRHKNGDIFELTGRKCQRCHVNPEAYGHGGGIRCFDVENCGNWFCY